MMFIRKDNTIIWKRVLLGAVITLACVIGGIFWFDKILYTGGPSTPVLSY